MPNLKITECEQCPYHRIKREEWMDDCYHIICEHEKQTNTEGFTHKMRYSNHIYFKCPLNDESEEDD